MLSDPIQSILHALSAAKNKEIRLRFIKELIGPSGKKDNAIIM
jgi:hypothetical protein